MDDGKNMDRLFKSLDDLVSETKDTNKEINKTNLELRGLRGDMNVINEKVLNLETHKAEKGDITNDIQLHEITCSTTRGKSSSGKFWSGMSAAQKTTIVGAVLTAIGSWVAMYINSLAV